jgi:uncharacterized protein YuzE
MNEPTFKYDEMSDTLFVSFSQGEKGAGIELNEQILLRVNLEERRAVGLTLFDYSVLAAPTELGFRSLPLGGLRELPAEIREMVIEILRSAPVNEVLSLSAYTPSVVEEIPITSLRRSVLERKAA